MHGIIFSELKKYVDDRLGGAAWGALLEKAGLSGRIYMPVQEYPDADAVKVVTTASAITGRPAPAAERVSAARARRDQPLVHDRGIGCIRILREAILAVEKILIAHGQRASGQRADIHPRTRAKQNAAGIEQKDLAVGGE